MTCRCAFRLRRPTQTLGRGSGRGIFPLHYPPPLHLPQHYHPQHHRPQHFQLHPHHHHHHHPHYHTLSSHSPHTVWDLLPGYLCYMILISVLCFSFLIWCSSLCSIFQVFIIVYIQVSQKPFSLGICIILHHMASKEP